MFGVFDESLWWPSQELGYLKDVNISLTDLKVFDQDGAVPLAVGAKAIDIGGGSELGVAPLMKTLPNLRWFLVGDIWKGFAFMIRPGSMKTQDDFQKQGNSLKDAARMTVQQWKGKTIIMKLGIGHDPALDAALSNGGLTRDDVKIMDMSTVEGATAFLRGEGDIYLGDLPSRFRLTEAGDVPALAADAIGPDAAAYVGFVTTADWLQSNHDTALRLLGVWYRVADLLKSDQADKALDIMRTHINKQTGASFDLETTRVVNTIISPWFTVEEAQRDVYTPGGRWDWADRTRYSIDYYVKNNTIRPGDVSPDWFAQAAVLFNEYISFKVKTETDLSAADAAIKANESGKMAKAIDLDNQAKWNYAIRNYFDSAQLAQAALNATK